MSIVRISWLVSVLVLCAAPLLPGGAQAQEPPTPTALQPLERLVGGSWHLGDDSRITFTWGVGRRSVKGEHFFSGPEGEKLVGETTFLYHPGRQRLVAVGVAIDMGIDFFEYTSIEARGDTLVLDLEVFGPAATDEEQRETWTFAGADRYEWVLWARPEGGRWQKRFEGLFERRR